jgi:hypothetical protein
MSSLGVEKLRCGPRRRVTCHWIRGRHDFVRSGQGEESLRKHRESPARTVKIPAVILPPVRHRDTA